MSDGETAFERELVGLCCDCAYQRVITSSKGSRFYLCMLSEKVPAFPKYPRLPVMQCAGFRPRRPNSGG